MADSAATARITVRYFAAARAAAGLSEESGPVGTVLSLRAELCRRHGGRFAAVLAASTLLCDGRSLDDDAEVPAGVTVDVLPPFAGG